MTVPVRGAERRLRAAIVLLVHASYLLGAEARAADDEEAVLPPEVRAVLQDEAAQASEPGVDDPPSTAPSGAPDATPLAPVPPGPVRPEASLLGAAIAASSNAEVRSTSDPLVTASLVVLGVGGALGAVGGVLVGVGSEGEICGLAGCVLREDEGFDDRRSAGFRLIGAGIGGGVVGLVGLGSALLAPLERDATRDAPAQLVTAVVSAATGGSLVGLGVAGAAQERVYADDAPNAALIVSGALAVGLGGLLLFARSSDDPEPDPGAPALTVGLGSARIDWRF